MGYFHGASPQELSKGLENGWSLRGGGVGGHTRELEDKAVGVVIG
jgi:hypothetical protein